MFIAHVAPEAILMSLACATTEGYDDTHGLYCSRGIGWCLVLPPKTMLRSMAYAEVRDLMWMPVVQAVRGNVRIHDLCSH